MKKNVLIVGAGLFGSVCAYELNKKGYDVLVIEKRNHIGGNCYTEKTENINVHKYGAHIFHTSNKKVWDYICQFGEFNNFINCPLANYKGEIYNLPFNMNTFCKIWSDVRTPAEAEKRINEERFKGIPTNLEEQAMFLVGKTIYEKLIKGYTEKQWGRECKDLPTFIIKRLPVRFTFDNNYFNDTYQGVAINGYTQVFESMLKNVKVKLNTDFLNNKTYYEKNYTIIYTGQIDTFYNYRFGKLSYRSLRFGSKILDVANYQGNAVVNFTSKDEPYTRIIEHKHFCKDESEKTIITYEYPASTGDPFYPINDEKNNEIYGKYKQVADSEKNIFFGGRLGLYEYLDMDDTIKKALELCDNF